MMRPYWQERTPWQVFTEFECKQNTHTRTHKKKPHLYPYNYIQKAAVLICVLFFSFFSTLLIVKAQAVPAFAETWTQCPCVQIIQILLCRPPLWLKHNPRACREAGEKGVGGSTGLSKDSLLCLHTQASICLSLPLFLCATKEPSMSSVHEPVPVCHLSFCQVAAPLFNDPHAVSLLLWKVQSGSPHTVSVSL